MAELVVLQMVGSEPEAELICSLLRSEGIPCIQQKTNYAAGVGDGMSVIGGPREIVVHAENLAAAQEIMDEQRAIGSEDDE
jgi:Putative prokaryotic signal transducing protein